MLKRIPDDKTDVLVCIFVKVHYLNLPKKKCLLKKTFFQVTLLLLRTVKKKTSFSS